MRVLAGRTTRTMSRMGSPGSGEGCGEFVTLSRIIEFIYLSFLSSYLKSVV